MLVILLASVFVLVLAFQFSRGFRRAVDRLEDRVAAAIAGGRLLTHPPKVAEETGGAPVAGEWQKAQAKASEKEPEAGDMGRPQVSAAGGQKGESGFVDETASPVVGGGGAQVGIQKPQEEAPVDTGVTGVVPESAMTQDQSEAKAPSQTKEEEEFSKKGIRFGEGEEEEAVGRDRFNWIRLILILLIALFVIYIIFEMVKAFKLSRSGKYK